jgi:hypothetical protein
MKRSAGLLTGALACVLVLGGAALRAQVTFKIPFKFESGSQKFPAGEYLVSRAEDGRISFRYAPSDREALVPVLNALPRPEPPLEGPQLIFDAVGNFEPSYTEYYTVYVLAEVWLGGTEGYLIHTTKGAHQTKIIKAEPAVE